MRTRIMALINKLRDKTRKPYDTSFIYGPAFGTERHCYVHPSNIATHMEYNLHDASYIRPVCTECVDPELTKTEEELEKVYYI